MTGTEVEALAGINPQLQTQLNESDDRLSATLVKLKETEIKLVETETRLSNSNIMLSQTESNLAKKIKSCYDLNQRVQEEVQKRHKLRSNRYLNYICSVFYIIRYILLCIIQGVSKKGGLRNSI